MLAQPLGDRLTHDTTMKYLISLAVVLALWQPLHAQMADKLGSSDYEIDPGNAGALLGELDNISFFKDNEFDGTVMKGYTLPGLWLQPKLVFYPLKNAKLELGAHALIYSGAYQFPSYAYSDISTWKGHQFQRGTHILPFFRAQVAFSRVNLVLGNLYGGTNHRLIEPLYNPELSLTADPESGFQLLYDVPRFHLDAWVNWQSFIFKTDTHQEAFTVGLSSEIRLNRPEARFHYYIPVQLMIQHRGGEQDTTVVNSVQTLANGAAGAGIRWNVNGRVLKQVNVEMDFLASYQQAGHLWPFDKGTGLYAKAAVTLGDVRLKGGYWIGKDYVSLFGIPYLGTLSTKYPGTSYDEPQTAFASVEYLRTLGKHYAFGAKADVYYSMPGTMTDESGVMSHAGSTVNFCFGVYFRANPSFLIKKFKF